jgi:hypothetical protein
VNFPRGADTETDTRPKSTLRTARVRRTYASRRYCRAGYHPVVPAQKEEGGGALTGETAPSQAAGLHVVGPESEAGAPR